MYHYKLYIYLIFTLICACASINTNIAKAEVIEKTSSFLGRHFIVAFMQNEIKRVSISETSYLSIFISSTQQDTVIVSRATKKDTFFLSPSEIREIVLPNEMEVRTIGISNDKQIEITSKHPITCWVYSSKNQSSDSYVAFPVGRWGYEHRVVSMPNDLYNGTRRQIEDNAVDKDGNIIDPDKYAENLTPRSGEFLVMACLDNTEVRYYPTANTANGVRRGDSTVVILNKGEVLFVQAAAGAIGTEDLTGTLVTSSNPIGLLSGHVRTAVMQGLDIPYDTKDHLVEMLPATNFWGRYFITVPFVDGQMPPANLCISGDLIRTVAAHDATKIIYYIHKSDSTFEEHTTTLNKAGDFFDFEANVPVIWTSNKPILVTQLMMHKGIDDTESLNYDPSLVAISPTEQFIESLTFSTPRNSKIFDQYKAHCIIIVADSTSIDNLYLDDFAVTEKTSAVWKKRIGDSKYYWLMLDVKNGNHKLLCKRGEFSGIIYGHGYRDSYGMTLGNKMIDPDKPDTLAPKIIVTDTCGKLHIRVTDITTNDPNATGIEWTEIISKNTKNYTIQPFEVSDTATIINIYAEPTDRSADATIEIEVLDKSYNKTTLQHNYAGFRVTFPQEYNFGKVNWISPTSAVLKLVNNSKSNWLLESINPLADTRLMATLPVNLPYALAPNETLSITITFTPAGTTNSFETLLTLNFNCEFQLQATIDGEVSAPGLLVNDLDFGKVRIGDTKTLSGKLLNAGNIDIEVSNFENIHNESAFSWSYSPSIPTFLAIDNEIIYTANFTPAANKQYDEHTNTINDALLDANFTTTGIGASPNIEDIYLDFGKRRLGTTSDTIIYLYNTGSYNDTINYKQDIVVTHPNASSLSVLRSLKNIILDEQDSLELHLNFAPLDTILMQNKVDLASQWTQHQPIFATITGQGTLPLIKIFDYDFGTISVHSLKQEKPILIESIGNEALTIDSIVAVAGDINSFIIDYDLLKEILLAENTSLDCAITFAPQFSGNHKLLLEVTHDANPAYIRSVDTIYITGNAISDSDDYKFSLQISQIDACNTTEATLFIENIGTGKLVIDSIELNRNPDVFEAEFTENIATLLPIEILAGNTLALPIKIYAERNKSGELSIIINYNSEVEKTLVATINPVSYNINSDIKLNRASLTPGDTVSLILQSSIEHNSEKEFNFSIKLHLEKKIFYILQKISYIDVLIGAGTGTTTKKVQSNLVQYDDFIEVELVDLAEQNIIINDKALVKLEIPFLVLLNSETNTEIRYEFISERCYNSGINVLPVVIEAVCAHNLRQIKIGNFPMMYASTNPANELLDIIINLPEEDIVTLQVVDVTGKIYYDKSNISLSSGKHNFIFDTSNFPTSEYFVKFASSQLNKTIKVLVIH